ncbi:hypothetical protein LMG28138_05276 [Pararobbsia alpina]|uniref:Uncharacterized protein n=1 Tax=Pararobbsia alpina TaxID=621374 RepID=A0A6S7BJW7_9BURK|nr:hypothetical protein LMG28138_05276 [Pararobbsia alpina]
MNKSSHNMAAKLVLCIALMTMLTAWGDGLN